jgi:antitoxin MazE
MYIRRYEMRTKIQKWGNSMGLRIPKSLAEELRIAAGSSVEIKVENGRIIIRPIRSPDYKLSDLLAGVTRDNLHGEITSGDPKGREAW